MIVYQFLISLLFMIIAIEATPTKSSRISRSTNNEHNEELLTFDTITDIIKFAQNKNCKRRRHSHEKVYFCPSAPADTDPSEWPCVRYNDLCDLRPDCPGMEDEHPTFCMFHQLRNAEMNGIRQTIAELAMVRLEEITKRRHSH